MNLTDWIGRTETLCHPGGDQQPERGSHAAQERRYREDEDAGEQQSSTTEDVAESSDADDQGCYGKQIGEDNPLDFLKGGGKHLRQRGQADIGNAGAKRRQQHR